MAKKKPKENAESMAARQREISVSEFFTKNRHLLGFDNPSKALLTAIKEAVDNSLDACEEAEILPDLVVRIEDLGKDRYRVSVQDNGPGIVKRQIPNIFGKLLYGSKFHRLKMSRGQQGIGISAAGMYGMLTTGKPVEIISRSSARRPAHFFALQIDTKKNKPEIIRDEEVEVDWKHGTIVSIELEGKHKRGRQSVDEYLRQTAIANPHIAIRYYDPNGEETLYERSVSELPPQTKEIKPHPHGVELGILQGMLKNTKSRSLSAFLQDEFSRVSAKVANEICTHAGLSAKGYASRIGREEIEKLLEGIKQTKIMNPPTNCVAPIGEEQLVEGLRSVVPADFYASTTRPPAVYRGNPFIIEAALAFGGEEQGADGPARILRYANRVPLQYQQGGCCSFQSVVNTNWKSYGLNQPRGAAPVGPVTIVVHMASVWVPFTSESKEAIAAYPEIEEQIRRALQECGRKLKVYLSKRRREAETARKHDYIQTYIPHIGLGLKNLIGFSDREESKVVETLTGLLERTRD
ncbi:MAG: DNA topoisomerase VI subunit B [Planctomycetota bacterium]|jgi:DNA topoisomerase-6 subunit B